MESNSWIKEDEWFKEQFNKLRQNIRCPIQPQRKSRGMKL